MKLMFSIAERTACAMSLLRSRNDCASIACTFTVICDAGHADAAAATGAADGEAGDGEAGKGEAADGESGDGADEAVGDQAGAPPYGLGVPIWS